MARRIAGGLVALGLLLGVVAWVSGGWSVVVLVSPSMEPYASPGDLLVHHRVPAEDVAVGDVVTVAAEGRNLATHRVVRLDDVRAGLVRARLKGDASPLPDPMPVLLQGKVARVVLVIPRVGSGLTAGAPLLWGGLVLLVLGGGTLVAARTTAAGPDPAGPDPGADASGDGRAAPPDPRLGALLATCEQFAEDGMPPVVLRDLVRVRAAALLGLPPAERAGAVLALDDGARFYVIALADADPDALAIIPTASQRRVQATDALDRWWRVVLQTVPADVAEQLGPWLEPSPPQ